MKSEIINAIDSLKDKSSKTLSTYIKDEFSNKEIVVYGAGGFGKEIMTVLLDHNIKPIACFDIKEKGSLFNIPIYHPNDFNNKNITIILSIVLNKKIRKEITDFLKNIGYKNIIDAQKIRAMYVELEKGLSYKSLKKNQELILEPLNYLGDEESQQTYTSCMVSHITRNYDNTTESNELTQYFLKNINFKKGFRRFVDCGAYNGDTFLELLKNVKQLEEYIGFEPIPETFDKLVNRVSSKKIKTTTFPVAVSNKTGMSKFDNKLGSSVLNEEGETQVMCVKLDDILHNYHPTFIKMDIEGEEINALNGAKTLITDSTPELAICVYHFINHFWEIPNLIHKWNLGYKLYMRTHSSACMETVLYAVKE